MPSFSLPSSIPLSSSPSPCISSFRSAHIGSNSDPACAISDGCMNNLFENPYGPPPPLSLSDPAPYSPPAIYPPVFPFGPPLFSSARFPPPPNSSYPQPFPNVTAFDGPPQYSSDITAYDRWSDRSISTPSGHDNISKCFTHWPLPSFNSNNSNSNFGFLKPEPAFPPVVPYPPLEFKLGPKFSPISRDSSASLNASFIPSTSSASIAAPLASSHFTSSHTPNLPFDFPVTSSRFPFNPNASSFCPGIDPSPGFGPCDTEFVPESIPSYLSLPGDFLSSSSFQASDHFHDASPRSNHPIDSAPLPVRSDCPSSYWGPHSRTSHGISSPNAVVSYSRPHISVNVRGPVCTSEATLVHESLCELPAPSPYPPPVSGTSFFDYSPSPATHPDNYGRSVSPRRYEDKVERIVSEIGKLMYQHMSPEEWRWKHYAPQEVEVPDPSTLSGSLSSAYNQFHGMDHAAIISPIDLGVRSEGSLLAALRSSNEKFDILERSKAESQSGPSLKLAASALAEMVALGSTGGTGPSRSLIGQMPSTSRTVSSLDAGFPPVSRVVDGHFIQEMLPEETCSSSASIVGHKETNDESTGQRLRRVPSQSYFGPSLHSTNQGEIENLGFVDNAFCNFGGGPVAWGLPKSSGQSHNLRPVNWIDAVPQSAKGGALQTNGQRRVFSKSSAGIIRQPSISTGRVHEANFDSNTPENLNKSYAYSPRVSPRFQSGRIGKVNSQPVVGLPSEDPSIIGFCSAKVGEYERLQGFGPHQEVSSGVSEKQLLADSSSNGEWHLKSTSCGSPPPLSQPYADQHGSISDQTTGAGSTVLAELNGESPQRSSQVETSYSSTGFHSLTASISNLSKVLQLFDSSALTSPNSAALEETLQRSILRLSECLLLEQSRMNRTVVSSHSVGYTPAVESVASRHVRADDSLTGVNDVCLVETGDSTNGDHTKVSDGDILTQVNLSSMTAQLCNSGTAAAAISGEDIHNISYQLSSYDLKSILDFLREHGLLELSSLERLVNAEAREAKLKVEMEELREELELEKVESRGAVFLCEKIMQEAEISRAQTARLKAENSNAEQRKGKIKSDQISSVSSFQGVLASTSAAPKGHMASSSGSMASCSQLQCSNSLMGSTDISCLGGSSSIMPTQDNKNIHEESFRGITLKVDSESFMPTFHDSGESQPVEAHANSSNDTVLESLHQMESRFAILLARFRGQSSDCESEDIESRIAVLKDRPSVPKCPVNSDDIHRDTDSQLELQDLKPAAVAGSLNCPGDDHVHESQLKAASYPDVSRDSTEMEERLALLQARPGWDNELGVFTETEPCTPDPAAVESDIGKGGSNKPSLLGVHEEQAAFMKKSMETISDIASQLLQQTKTISNMRDALSQFSEEVDENSVESLSKQEPGPKEIISAEIYDESQAIQARAQVIKSRPDWTEDEFESEPEDCLGDQICKLSSGTLLGSGSGRCEYDQFNEISTVRLLDSDPEMSQPRTEKNTSLHGGETTTEEPEDFELELVILNVTTPEPQVEEESGWEHVRLSRVESD